MKNFEARIRKLEEARVERHEPIIVGFVSAGDDCPPTLDGYTYSDGHETVRTIREPGESDDALLARAKLSISPLGSGVPVFFELLREA